jgi:hypothetical protein
MAYDGSTKFNTPKDAVSKPYRNNVLRPGQGRQASQAARLRSVKQGAGLKGPSTMG